jgi:hypothetical protein
MYPNLRVGTATDLLLFTTNEMSNSEPAYLKMLWDNNVCPFCHETIPEGKRVGSGRKSDGGFCGLDCFSKYHALKFAEKTRLRKRRMPPVQ